jgi:hypothetical protein
LLVLTGEIVFADRAADAIEGVERLALTMQGLALTSSKASRSPDRLDPVHLVGFRDRRKADHFPLLLREHVADEVVLVQALHDDHDCAAPLVVEPTVQRVGEPVVGRFALCVGKRLVRLQRVID